MGQIGMQNLLYSKSYPSLLTKLNLGYYGQKRSHKILTLSFLMLSFPFQRSVHNISHASRICKSCTAASAAMLQRYNVWVSRFCPSSLHPDTI